MEPLSRKEIKEVFSDAIAPLIAEFKASHDAHEKELERLTKQSAEHYQNFKALEEKLSKQVEKCSIANSSSQEKTGVRMGTTEKDIARIDQKIEELEHDISEMKNNKQFNISQWLVVAGVLAMIIIGVIPLIKG